MIQSQGTLALSGSGGRAFNAYALRDDIDKLEKYYSNLATKTQSVNPALFMNIATYLQTFPNIIVKTSDKFA